MIVLVIAAGLAFVAGLAVGLFLLFEYMFWCESPGDAREVQSKLRFLQASHDIAVIEAETQRQMFEAALKAEQQAQGRAR